MPTVRLTRDHLEAAPPSQREILWDARLAGFGVARTPNGTQTFVARYRTAHGTDRRMALGKYPALSVAEARDRARAVLAAAARGEDPLAQKRAERRAETMDALFEVYAREHAVHKRSGAADRAIYEQHASPVLGRMKVAEVTRGDILRMRTAITAKAKAGRSNRGIANRTVALVSVMFRVAEDSGMRDPGTNPAYRIPRFKQPIRRDKYLAEDELRDLLSAVERSGDRELELACKLLAFTGCRTQEVLTLTRADVDLRRMTIAIRQNKEGKPREVPIAQPLADLLRPIAAERLPNARLFTLTYQRMYHRLKAVAKTVGLEKISPHWLRHTFASLRAKSGVSLYVVGEMLGHARGSQHTARYAHLSDDHMRGEHERAQQQIAEVLGHG